MDTLLKMTEVEFKALEILENGFQRFQFVNISWNGDALAINGPLPLAYYAKTDLNSRLMFLKNKQSDEISLDEEDRKYLKDVIGKVQSMDTICVYDEMKSRVVIYSDNLDDIKQFKHQIKFKTGKVKESGRSIERFTEEAQSLETSQENLSSSVRSSDIQRRFSWSKDASNIEKFYTKENIKVAVYNANILNLPVECIVNAANEDLAHSGGVAKVISDAAGPELIQQKNALIVEQIKGKVPVGCQVTTTAGRLPYKCVIHTVGPCWSDYQPHNLQKVQDCERDLYAAIFGCFLEAEKNCVSTIALPAVSSGIYAVPQDMCAVQYAKAVLEYSRNSREGKSLKEIHFIDKSTHLVQLMQYTFRTMIQHEKVPDYNIQSFVASSSRNQRQGSNETGRKGCEKQDVTASNCQYETTKLKALSPFYYESVVHHTKQFVFQIPSKPVVCIYEGDILKLKYMDAIVCPDDTNGNGKGSIALELGEKTKYKKRKEKCFKSEKPDLGDVVITRRNKTPFSLIFHVVIENDSPQKSEFTSTIKMSIDNILRKSNECVDLKTIAMPLFGVGFRTNWEIYGIVLFMLPDMQVEPEQDDTREQELLTEKSWAELFLERFVAFCHEVKNPNLEEIHIITHCSSSSAYPTAKKVFRKYADEINNTHPQEKVPPSSPPPHKNCRMNDQKQDHMSGTEHELKIDEGDSDNSCTICKCLKTDPKSLSCGHSFCSECIDQMFKHKPVCPICGTILGTLTDDQPDDGKMDVKTSSTCLAGYEGYGCIVITYDFAAGKQGKVNSEDRESKIPQKCQDESPNAWRNKVEGISALTASCPSKTYMSEVDRDDIMAYMECKIEVAEDVWNSIKITYGQQGIDSLISDLDQIAKVDTHEGRILVLCDYKYAENVQKCVRNHYNKAKEERKIKIKEENKHLINGGNENLKEWLQFVYGHTSWSKNLQLEGGKLYFTGTLQMKREVEKAVHSMNYWYKEEFALTSEEQQKADEVVAMVKSELPTIFIKQTKETIIILSDNRENFERANFKVKVALGRIKITARGRGRRDPQLYSGEFYSGFQNNQPTTVLTPKSYCTKEGLTAKAYLGNITSIPVDCIVNAANRLLSHDGGVALAISKAASEDFDQEGEEYVRKNGPVQVTQCWVTSAGRLPYKLVIHAVGPQWSDYKDNEKDKCIDDLKKTIVSCLIKANKFKMASIAIPPLSSGIFGVPKELCAEMYAKGVVEYSKTYGLQSVKEIHFVDTVSEMCQLTQSAFDKELQCN